MTDKASEQHVFAKSMFESLIARPEGWDICQSNDENSIIIESEHKELGITVTHIQPYDIDNDRRPVYVQHYATWHFDFSVVDKEGKFLDCSDFDFPEDFYLIDDDWVNVPGDMEPSEDC